jgi:hypothetical protein
MIDQSRLENVKQLANGTIKARCPQCAVEGSDKSGNHLRIDPDGRFGCVIYPKAAGEEHRKQIFALVGIRSGTLGTPFSNPNAYGKSKKHISIPVKSLKQASQPSQARRYDRHGNEIDIETGYPIIDGAICPF